MTTVRYLAPTALSAHDLRFMRALAEEFTVVRTGPADVTVGRLGLYDGQQPYVGISWGDDLLGAVPELCRKAVQGAAHVIVDTVAGEAVAARLGASAGAVTRIAYGVDLSFWQPMMMRYARTAYVVACPRANGAGLVERACRILHEAGEPIVYRGPEPRSRYEMRDLYREADLYVTGAPVDGSSCAMLQAMACGLPVLVPDNAGNAEWTTLDERYEAGNLDALIWALAAGRRQPAARNLPDWTRHAGMLRLVVGDAARRARQCAA